METIEDLKRENEALKERVQELEETRSLYMDKYFKVTERFESFKNVVKNMVILVEE